MDLQPFFNTLVSSSFSHGAANSRSPLKPSVETGLSSSNSCGATFNASLSTNDNRAFNLAQIEQVIERDFLEPLPG